ncbi:hypothetical protein, partial [Pseudomonas sp.]|uniref:hypothetical protein n=1 Tax=Pseudomonas sp. TaxID=306 RepID=UPI0028B1594A
VLTDSNILSGRAGWEVVPLYTHADPNVRWKAVADEQMEVIAGLKAEVERLRAELDEWKKRCQYNADTAHDVGRECETLRAQLAERDALLRECQPCLEKAGYGTWQIDEMLSASAEPSAPIAWHVGGNGYNRICFEEPTDLPGHPCIQAIHDQRQLIELLKRYDLRDEDAPPDERAHGIPGTSFQRLNALANQGE